MPGGRGDGGGSGRGDTCGSVENGCGGARGVGGGSTSGSPSVCPYASLKAETEIKLRRFAGSLTSSSSRERR